jgi:hypothetical protein
VSLHRLECSEVVINVTADAVELTIVRGIPKPGQADDQSIVVAHDPVGVALVDTRSLLEGMKVAELRSFIGEMEMDSKNCVEKSDMVERTACVRGNTQAC